MYSTVPVCFTNIINSKYHRLMKLELLARRRAGQRDGRCQADDDLEGG